MFATFNLFDIFNLTQLVFINGNHNFSPKYFKNVNAALSL